MPLPDGSRADDTDRWGGVEPAAPTTDHDTAMVVRQALAGLPVEQRAALVLVDVQGYPVAEVAVMLGVAEGTVKSRCARGRARLALQLADLRPDRSAEPPTARPGTSARVRPFTSGNPDPADDVRSRSARRGSDSKREDQ